VSEIMVKKTALQIVSDPAPSPTPPRTLGRFGLALWQSIHAEYQLDDAAGIEMLLTACQALDRAEDCARIIENDGPVVKTNHGPKEHSLLKCELANRAFAVRTLQKLGLNYEPIRNSAGRPPGYA
jgi:hypothetical protein